MKAEDKDTFFKDNTKLAKLVQNHIVDVGYQTKDLVDGFRFKTLDNQDILISNAGGIISFLLGNNWISCARQLFGRRRH